MSRPATSRGSLHERTPLAVRGPPNRSAEHTVLERKPARHSAAGARHLLRITRPGRSAEHILLERRPARAGARRRPCITRPTHWSARCVPARLARITRHPARRWPMPGLQSRIHHAFLGLPPFGASSRRGGVLMHVCGCAGGRHSLRLMMCVDQDGGGTCSAARGPGRPARSNPTAARRDAARNGGCCCCDTTLRYFCNKTVCKFLETSLSLHA